MLLAWIKLWWGLFFVWPEKVLFMLWFGNALLLFQLVWVIDSSLLPTCGWVQRGRKGFALIRSSLYWVINIDWQPTFCEPWIQIGKIWFWRRVQNHIYLRARRKRASIYISHRLKNSIITDTTTQSLRHRFFNQSNCVIYAEMEPQTSGPSVRNNAIFKTMCPRKVVGTWI